MYEQVTYTIEGVPPGMLQHNPRLANPMDEYSRAIKAITQKRSKTEADMEELSRLEWYGGLYLNSGGRVIVTSSWIKGCFIEMARKNKKGQAYTMGLMVPDDAILLYNGPEDIDALYLTGKFTDTRSARPRRQGRVMRTRPKFPEWKLTFPVAYLPDILNPSEISATLHAAGIQVGLSDYRPTFGRFTVLKEVKG